MKQCIILILVVFYFGCIGQQRAEYLRYTEKQIASLNLDSTKILKVEIDSITTIDMNPFLQEQVFDFGALVEEIKLVPLETTDESLVDDIYKILVTDSHIYIYDSFKGGGLIVFDINGNFIRRIPNGQGPGEVGRLYDIAYDVENHELVAYQHSFLLFFTPLGQYIRKERLPFGFYNFTVIPNGYLFKTLDKQGNGHLGHFEDYTLFITDKNFKLKSVALPAFPCEINYGGSHYVYDNNHDIKITQNFIDTVYQYLNETNSLKAKYVLNYSKKKIPAVYMKGSYDEFENAVRQNNYYFYIGEYFETESHHAFILNNKYIKLNSIIYRDKKTGNMVGGTHANFNPNEIPSIGFPETTSDNYFISVYYPFDENIYLTNSAIVSKEDKKKLKKLKEDDNQILAFFKLKNF
jgi:hypothetical protein